LLTLQEGGTPNSPKKTSPVKQQPQTKATASTVKKPGQYT
jgi:hypothetical protein